MNALSLLAALLLTFPNLEASPQASAPASTTSTQAVTLLAQSVAALTGKATLSDVTLTGTARRIAGSDDESGSVTLQVLSGGYSKIQLSLPSGSRSEVHTMVNSTPAGSWSGPDGISRQLAQHNLIGDPGLFPVLALASILSSQNSVATMVGQETKNGQAVEHISVSQISNVSDPLVAASFAHLTHVDFYLDSATLLPAAVSFNAHPDNNALLDIPVQIVFSSYQTISGVKIPMHVQKFFNNSLLLDLQFQSASINSGLTASAFGAL